MKHILICTLTLLPLPVLAQEDDKGWLTNWLEENLSGAGRQVVAAGYRPGAVIRKRDRRNGPWPGPGRALSAAAT